MEYASIYVYGIVSGQVKDVFLSIGIGERDDDVTCIPFKDVSAVISYTPFEEYDPTEENTLAHENVIQTLLKKGYTVAPMRFCTVLRNKNDLMKLLHSGYLSFKKNLLKIRDKHEFDIKIFFNTDTNSIQEKLGQDIITKSKTIAEIFYTELNRITVASVLSDQVTDEMILNASFLVHREKRETFIETINNLDSQYTDTLKVRISGPTAPYNFVSMPTR